MLPSAITLAAENGHDIDLVAAYPVFVLAGAGVLGLIAKMIWRERAGIPALVLVVLGLLGAFAAALYYLSPNPVDWHPLMGLLQLDPLGALAQAVIFGGALVALIIALPMLKVMGERSGEFLVVFAFAVSGLAIIVISIDFLTLFTGIALVVTCNFILLGMQHRDLPGTEVSLKYFITSLVASALLLFGMALVYAASGDTQYQGVTDGLQRAGESQLGIMVLGLGLIMAGFAWQLGLVPMHMHLPDLYQAAPAPTAPYIAMLPPLASLVVLTRLLAAPLSPGAEALRMMIVALAVLTIVLAALLSWAQSSSRRASGYVAAVVVAALFLAVGWFSTEPIIERNDSMMLVMSLAFSTSMLLALGILAGTLGRFSEDSSSLPAVSTIVSRMVAGGTAFIIGLLLLIGAVIAVAEAPAPAGKAIWYWLISAGLTIAAARMMLVYAAQQKPWRHVPADRKVAGAMWLILAAIVVVAPVLVAYVYQGKLAQLIFDSL